MTYLLIFYNFCDIMFKNIKLGDIAKIYTGVRVSRVQDGETRPMPVLKRTSEENSSKLEYEMEEISIDIDPKYLSEKDDILILLSGSNNITKIEREGFVIPMYYAIIKVNYGYDPDFIYHILKSEVFPRELNRLMEGTTLKIIKTRDLKEMIIPVPDYETQRDYGELFKLMDKRIELKKEALQIEEEIQQSIIDDLLRGENHVR